MTDLEKYRLYTHNPPPIANLTVDEITETLTKFYSRQCFTGHSMPKENNKTRIRTTW